MHQYKQCYIIVLLISIAKNIQHYSTLISENAWGGADKTKWKQENLKWYIGYYSSYFYTISLIICLFAYLSFLRRKKYKSN